MIRSIGIALVILGLVTQLLSAAIPTLVLYMDDASTQFMVVSDIGEMLHADHVTGLSSSKAPCHDKTVGDASSESCGYCENDCENGACASSCVTSGVAAFQKSAVNFVLYDNIVAPFIFMARTYELPSRIFHPPKHA